MRCGAARRVVTSSRVQQRFARKHSPRTGSHQPSAHQHPCSLDVHCIRMTCVSPTGLPGRSLSAGFAHDERYAGKSVGEKARTVADPRMAVFGFNPWIYTASASRPNDGLAGFCDPVAEPQRAMGASGASLHTVAAVDEVRRASAARRSALRRSGRACLPPRGRSGPTALEWSLVYRVSDSGTSRNACGQSRGC